MAPRPGPGEAHVPGASLPLAVLQYVADVELERGGIVRAVLDLSAGLATRGHAVTLATCTARDIPAGWGGPGTPGVLRLSRGPGGIRFTAAASAMLRDAVQVADVVHVHNLWNPELRHVAAIARRAGRPYVITPHGTLDPWSMAQRPSKKRAYLAAGGRRLIEGAAAVHFTAEEEERAAQRWVKPSRRAVIPYLIDLRPFLSHPAVPAAGPVPRVLFLSRLHEKKRLDLLLRATARLAESGVPTEVLVAGTGEPGYVDSMAALVARLGLAGQVNFLGKVGGAAKLDLLASADVMAVPTSQENFGIVFVEALASAVPVVASTGTDIWRELEATGGAQIVDLDSTGDPVPVLADALRGLLADPVRRSTMGRAGRAGVQAWLDPERTAVAFEQLYAGVAAIP